ncbi:AlpA family transcriptional regulator [Vibrio sp. 10N.222.55.C6]|uniref:AlpA family transcriptional regulator n=1 Tax=Vibrio sp. 10N.222.55.C6 TaxID=3229649 RepID=UPI0035507A8B
MRFLKIKEVMKKTALSRSSIYRKISEGSFPKPAPIGERAVAWLDNEVEECLNQR